MKWEKKCQDPKIWDQNAMTETVQKKRFQEQIWKLEKRNANDCLTLMTKSLNTYQALETFEWNIPSDEEKSKNYSKIRRDSNNNDDDDKARAIATKTSNKERKIYMYILYYSGDYLAFK